MSKLLFYTFFSLALLSLLSCRGVKDYASSAQPISHELWDSLVRAHVNPKGNVDYQGFIKDSLRFNKYLQQLQQSHANDSWTEAQQLAYWINAYNAFTVKLIVDHYPVKSIKDIKKGIPFINSVWDMSFIKIEGATYSLGNIEHDILRKKYEEPRIHFAINCASFSCPVLLNEAYTAQRLEEQLTQQSKAFLSNPEKNEITADKLKLSKIFRWFKGDFQKKGTLIAFLNQYSPVEISAEADYTYKDYNWNLNE